MTTAAPQRPVDPNQQVNVQGPPLQKRSYTPQEAGQLGLGWVDPNNPNYGKPGFVGSETPTPGAPGTGGSSPSPTGQPTTQAGVLGGTATVGAQPQQGAPTTVAGAFQQALVNRLAPQDITSSNPAIAGSIEANRNAEARGLKKTQGALAERAAATGQAGGLETGLRTAMGESAGRQGAFEGNALFGLHQQQQNDLTNALSLGGNLLSDQQRQDTQRYGLDLDAALRREGLGVQRDLGGRELDIRNSLGQGQLNLGRLGLSQNESQFGRSLGANLGVEQARLNQQALLSLLGGL
jgi:hypothetical protein